MYPVFTLHQTLTGFSRAMFSNWLWHRPLNLLVDAGEGVQLALGAKIWAIETLLLTHGHADHLLGLPGFVASRRFSKGAQDKPLTVVYPGGNSGVETIRAFLSRLWPNETFPVTWTGVAAGDELPLGKGRVLHAFKAEHGTSEPALGYRVLDQRRRLRAEFAGLPEREIRDRVRTLGRDTLMEPYRHVLFAHTGDSMPLDPALVERADLVVHDATFLEPGDRKWDIHASSVEVLAMAREARIACLVLNHLSVRYDRGEALPSLRAQVAASGFEGGCWLLDDGRLIPLHNGAGTAA
ncbi:MAG: MBL fold metallo-hydrolase [Acidobacteriota bacterium]